MQIFEKTVSFPFGKLENDLHTHVNVSLGYDMGYKLDFSTCRTDRVTGTPYDFSEADRYDLLNYNLLDPITRRLEAWVNNHSVNLCLAHILGGREALMEYYTHCCTDMEPQPFVWDYRADSTPATEVEAAGEDPDDEIEDAEIISETTEEAVTDEPVEESESQETQPATDENKKHGWRRMPKKPEDSDNLHCTVGTIKLVKYSDKCMVAVGWNLSEDKSEAFWYLMWKMVPYFKKAGCKFCSVNLKLRGGLKGIVVSKKELDAASKAVAEINSLPY